MSEVRVVLWAVLRMTLQGSHQIPGHGAHGGGLENSPTGPFPGRMGEEGRGALSSNYSSSEAQVAAIWIPLQKLPLLCVDFGKKQTHF